MFLTKTDRFWRPRNAKIMYIELTRGLDKLADGLKVAGDRLRPQASARVGVIMFSQVENPSQHIWKLLGLFFQIFYSLLKTKNSNWFSRVLVSFTLLSHCSSWHSSFRIVWTSVMIMQLLPTGLLQHFTNKTQCILYLCYTVYSLYKVLIVVCLERFLWKLLACSLLSPLDAKTFHHDSILSFEIISALFCSLIKKVTFFS